MLYVPEQLLVWQWLLIGFLVAASSQFVLKFIKNPYIFALVVLPGVITHEFFGHWIPAKLTFARPVGLFSLIPKKNNDGTWTLGSVVCGNITWYNGFPVAMSPLLLLLTPFLVYKYLVPMFGHELELYQLIIVAIITIIVTSRAMPSRQDFKVAASKPFGSFLWLVFLVFVFVEPSSFYDLKAQLNKWI